MRKISDIPGDLVGEIFSRVPLTSLGLVRSTCKTWNDLSKNHTLGQKARKSLFLEFLLMHDRVYSLRFDLQRIRNHEEDEENLVDSSLNLIISIPNTHQDKISHVFHCSGLLLCVTKDNTRLIVWNPYLGQTRLIQPRRSRFCTRDGYALGYDNNNCSFKILRVFHELIQSSSRETNDPYKMLFDIYDFSSDSWRSLDVSSGWEIPFYLNTVSLKGNTYFFGTFEGDQKVAAETVNEEEEIVLTDYLRCFDFTTERFGPRLSMPFQPYSYCTNNWILSRVTDEKLAVAYSNDSTNEITEIWITTKIEPNAVSWSKFMTLDMRLINGIPGDGFKIHYRAKSFFIDEEKKIAVFLDGEVYGRLSGPRYQMAYIFGDDGYFKSVNMGKIPFDAGYHTQLACSSYVPSLAQLQINQEGERKEQINQSDERKEQINQQGKKKRKNQPGKRRKKERNQSRKWREIDADDKSVPFSKLYFFLSLFIFSFLGFYFLFTLSNN